MATVTRQPFGVLDGARLQNLTSIKNRQNALLVNSPMKGKRKAEDFVDSFDSENVDPSIFSKRAKGGDEKSFYPVKDFVKPSPFVLTRAVPTITQAPRDVLSPLKAAAPRLRTFLQPKSPAARFNTTIAKSSSMSAPAGRSPTRGSKRIGILSKRRTGGSFGRVDPPSFNLGSAAPFSLDAALKGTIPSYSGRSSASILPSSLGEPELNSSWFFDIHEDTSEQEMTNLLQHNTCTLDISSDEETELKARRARDEGLNKENIAPLDDVSQTQARRLVAPASPDEMVFEKTRGALVEMNAADYYAEGCDATSVVIVAEDDEVAETVEQQQVSNASATVPAVEVVSEVAPEQVPLPFDDAEDLDELKVDAEVSIDVLMGKASNEPASKAALLQPIEGTGESFELWESGSFKDEADPVAPASPRQESADQENAVPAC